MNFNVEYRRPGRYIERDFLLLAASKVRRRRSDLTEPRTTKRK